MLFADQILYLGHVITAASVYPDLAKLRVLFDWLILKTVREMQCFLKFVNFYGDYISDASELTGLLNDLTAARKGDKSIKLTAYHFEKFKEIKRRLCAAPRLAHSDLNQPFVFYTDASKIAVGSELLQRDNSGIDRAFWFFLKKLSPAQQNYPTIELELFAINCEFERFQLYLHGRKVRLRTDHRALARLFSKKPKVCARISGWLSTLIKYLIVIEYVDGSKISIVNAFLRYGLVAVDNEAPNDLEKIVSSFVFHATQVNRLEARTD